jgi:hypothetical protein
MQQVSSHLIMTGHGFSKRAIMRHIAANSIVLEPSCVIEGSSYGCSNASSDQVPCLVLHSLHQVKMCCVGQTFKVQMSSHKVTLHTRCLFVRHRAVDAGLCNGVFMNAGTPLAGNAVNHFYTFANQLARLAAGAPLVVGMQCPLCLAMVAAGLICYPGIIVNTCVMQATEVKIAIFSACFGSIQSA